MVLACMLGAFISLATEHQEARLHTALVGAVAVAVDRLGEFLLTACLDCHLIGTELELAAAVAAKVERVPLAEPVEPVVVAHLQYILTTMVSVE
jgi:hypothetical protein